ncbi:hypothetical protein [Fimbriiglobus ruber]|uniref:Uncharacterized protein n=1 Tax=Fimbriiglobus ruber TaxID=1908690 RepID=A0A225DNU8_9BACT|nr:hypothetical protein [Fimbriiglobus ruber]OWK38869.1 hypothetical protein FRUB_06374 [Fimbriiglobus ruber]
MTEADWLKAKNPDAMLRLLDDRLSPRQWHLLACAVVRRAWDVLPGGPLRAAVEWAEQHPGDTGPDAAALIPGIEPAARVAAEEAQDTQRQIVAAADPDADPDSFRHTDERKTNPSAPLFQAACRAAGSSVEQAGEAVTHAAEAVAALLSPAAGAGQLTHIRECVVTATRVRAGASLYAASALKLKAQGDEAADQDTKKNVRLRSAIALETVGREEEQAAYKHGDLQEQKEKADKKAVGRFALDLFGNPFKPYRFEPAWRTSTVTELARTIYADRAWDRMPILADALLDADCDEEAILRHCRGTEAHTPDGPAHGRGCWVLDLILEHEPAFFAAPPIKVEEKPPLPRRPGPPTPGGGWARLLDALQDDPDDDDE